MWYEQFTEDISYSLLLIDILINLGLHINAALEGVEIKDRCEGWKTGSCPKAPAGSQRQRTACSVA